MHLIHYILLYRSSITVILILAIVINSGGVYSKKTEEVNEIMMQFKGKVN